jgi:hypothetical protein
MRDIVWGEIAEDMKRMVQRVNEATKADREQREAANV